MAVSDPLYLLLALELGERQEHVKAEPPVGSRCVNVAVERLESNIALPEIRDRRDPVGDVAERPIQPDDYDHARRSAAPAIPGEIPPCFAAAFV